MQDAGQVVAGEQIQDHDAGDDHEGRRHGTPNGLKQQSDDRKTENDMDRENRVNLRDAKIDVVGVIVDIGRRQYGRHGEKPVEDGRSEEHTSELQSLMRSSYAVFCLKKKNTTT